MNVTTVFLDLLADKNVKTNENKITLETCPCCNNSDYVAGFVLKDGGFIYHCFHRDCLYHRSTGWSIGGVLGHRVIELYESLGGDPADLIPTT